jgi:hypothetical protein
MCIKDPINKTCWKIGKDLSNGLLKLNFKIIQKKCIFRFLPKISASHGWSWKFFFAYFQILGPLGCQGCQGYLKMWKNSKSLHTTLHPSELHCTLFIYTVPLSYTKYYWFIHRCTQLSYPAPYWALLHPFFELRCTLRATLRPLSHAAPHRVALHSTELRCTLLSYLPRPAPPRT